MYRTTNAIGIISKSGRYGGTYAHKDRNNEPDFEMNSDPHQ